jgi:DtxR family transcriptional regulator, Mn-dependent transcriptional regulator
MPLTYTEENYLKAIFHLAPEDDGPVSTNALSARLCTQPASVSDMLRKLAAKQLVEYRKYRGVQLTSRGRTLALQVIRNHRLWEVFLVEKLNFTWDEVHEVAEELEHIRSPLLVQRLDEYLGRPRYDPHGDPIPDELGLLAEKNEVRIADLQRGESGRLSGIVNTGAPFLRYLDRMHIRLGDRLRVLEKMDFDGSMLIEIGGHQRLNLSREVTENLMITP